MDRVHRLLGSATRSAHILEIGPCHAPAAPKREGWNSHVVDHTDRAGLVAKYHGHDIDLSLIEAVDTIWSTPALHDSVPAALHGTFDRLIASHVIEHLPDLVGFLRSAALLCRPEGVMALAIPDPRRCFDYFKPQTTTGDLLEAYLEGRSRHGLRALWNQTAYAVTRDGAMAWGADPVGKLGLQSSFGIAEGWYRHAASGAATGDYVDCHCWVFTPAGFRLAILELGRLGLIDWRVDSVTGPDGFEYFVELRRGVEQFPTEVVFEERRLALLRDRLRETAEQVALAAPLLGQDAAAADPGLLARLDGLDHRVRRLEDIVVRLRRAAGPFRPLLRRLRIG